jgi:hypothetical protein
MKILVVSEGKHELNLNDNEPTNGPLVRLISRVLLGCGHQTISFERRPVKDLPPGISVKGKVNNNYQRKAMQWIHHAERDGFDAIVMIVDQDQNPERRIGLDAAQSEARYTLPRAIGLAVESFDAWMLVDEVALSTATGFAISRQKDPEPLRNPKEVLHTLIARAQDSPTAVYLRIADCMRVETLIERCPQGFAPFHERLQTLPRLS